ncbi:MAG: hypothetical protein H7Z12_09105 [Rhodospirillaceae bacterium]|nr:hypothetical protein [Rhodospirillales bacterium]
MKLDPSLLSRGALTAMAAAGDEIVALEADMRARGTSPRALLLGPGEPTEFRHYPAGDSYDFGSHSQFYFHVHRANEHGHIHTFLRPLGMPPGVEPVVSAGSVDAPCHLIAVGLNGHGFASELFTTNRWVTGESWYAADDVAMILPRFHMGGEGGAGLAGRWLTALLALFRPLVVSLVEQRDETVAAWSLAHPGTDPLADAGLELTSRATIDLNMWRKMLAAERSRENA